MKEEIRLLANGFLGKGMKGVIVSLEPEYALSTADRKHAVVVQNYSIVAFKDEIEYDVLTRRLTCTK